MNQPHSLTLFCFAKRCALRQKAWGILLVFILFSNVCALPKSYAKAPHHTEPSTAETPQQQIPGHHALPLSTGPFTLNNIEFETSCLIKAEQFAPLYKPFLNKTIEDAELAALIRKIRGVLAKQGFRSIEIKGTSPRGDNGILKLSIKASVPEAMANEAKTQCADKPVFMEAAPVGRKTISHVELSGVTQLDPQPFIEEGLSLQGKPFNAVSVVHLMQSIRKAYTDAQLRAPYVLVDKAALSKGMLTLKVVEKHKKPAPVLPIKGEQLSDDNLKVVPPVPTPNVATSNKQHPAP